MVKLKMKKNAQMKIQQMAFMLMAVTLFFVLVGMFVLLFSSTGLKQTALALEEKNTLLLVSKLANSPEFSCGNSFGSNKINCIDEDKVMVLKDSIEKYRELWGSGIQNIIIRTIPIGEAKLCTLGSYSDCNTIDIFSKGSIGFPIENFVSLCRKQAGSNGVYDKCEIAKLAIYYNEKQ
jgi:hypothetical protein